MPHLFVYGTLRSNFSNRYTRYLASNATLIGPAQIDGRLYALRNYPAFRRSTTHSITGELWRLHNPSHAFAVLDRYEGRQYRRIRVIARTNKRIPSWVYEWHWPLPEWRSIPSGDYATGVNARST